MIVNLRLFAACVALLSLTACDQVKSFLPQQKPAPSSAGRSQEFTDRLAIEAKQLPLHPDIAKRDGDLLTVSFGGKTVATFRNHMDNCQIEWPVCEGWTFIGTADLKNPQTGKIESFARVTWSYGQSGEANAVPPETYVVDARGNLYYIGFSEPLYSPSHSFMVTKARFDEITILDWTQEDGFVNSYTFTTLVNPDSWMDDTHISGSSLPNEGLVTSIISRQKDRSWLIRDLEFYEGQDAVKPGAVGKKLNNPPELIKGHRSSYDDMDRMQVHGYWRNPEAFLGHAASSDASSS
jgi:hypothetical protein